MVVVLSFFYERRGGIYVLFFTTYQGNSIIKSHFNRNNDILLQDGELLSNCLKHQCKHPEHNNNNELPPIIDNDAYICTENSFLLCTEDEKSLIC